MSRRTQYDQIGALIKRKCGATPLEMMTVSQSTCVHKRLSELRNRGWKITRKEIPGRTHGVYFGVPPKKG